MHSSPLSFRLAILLLGLLLAASQKPSEKNELMARSPRIRAMRIVQPSGVRPRFAPTGERFVFDRKNPDGFYDLYLSDLTGQAIPLTDGKTGIPQRNNGNGVFDPTGRFVIFISEAPDHYMMETKYIGDPGLGLCCNLWATDLAGSRFWRLTDIAVKKSLLDGAPAVGCVNPHFSRDGKMLIWTEHYDQKSGQNRGGRWRLPGADWGKWRIRGADFSVAGGVPRLSNNRILYTPTQGNYVTFMGELPSGEWILAGNLDGQHEFGMDQYLFNPKNLSLANLTRTPEFWEEDASILATPAGPKIVFMSNADSRVKMDFDNPNWPAQPTEREYYLMDPDGGRRERLTWFNDPAAPEYQGRRALVAASDASADGRRLLGSLGVDFGTARKRDVALKIVLIEFR